MIRQQKETQMNASVSVSMMALGIVPLSLLESYKRMPYVPATKLDKHSLFPTTKAITNSQFTSPSSTPSQIQGTLVKRID